MAVTASVRTLQDYLDQAAPVLLEIPGLSQLMRADGNSYDVLAGMYPDAAFTLMVMNNLFHHDCEFSEIYQQAFSAGQIFHLYAGVTTFAWMHIGRKTRGMTDLWNSLKSLPVHTKD